MTDKIQNRAGAQSLMRYGISDNMRAGELIFYAIQHLVYFLANAAILPVIVGGYLGLSPQELFGLLQRTFVLCGFLSILQAVFGHRFPVMEGPAGLWYGVIIMLANFAPSFSKPLAVLRTDIEMGFLAAGAVCVLLGATGMVGRILKIFTPIVNGTFLVLMAIQLSPAIIKGLLGIRQPTDPIHFKGLLVAVVTILIIVLVNMKAKGMFQSLAILTGAGVGWLMHYFLGLQAGPQTGIVPRIISPDIFAWGAPTFDAGVIFTFILSAVVLFSNLVATIIGMGNVTGERVYEKTFDRGAMITGVSDAFAGLGAVIGFIPYGSAIALTAITRVASRKPFILGAVFLIILGVIPQIGMVFISIPATVGNSVMFVVFTLILGMGIKEFAKIELGDHEIFVIGISLLIGVGIMFLPKESCNNIPYAFRYILLNGLVVGVMVAIALEQTLLRKRVASSMV